MDEPRQYTAIPTLLKFHEDPSQLRCVVGPVGSGKTTAATWEICYLLPKFIFEQYGIRKTKWVVVRNTYPELIDTTQRTLFDWFGWGKYNKQEKNYILRHKEGFEAEILFRSCDNPDDVKKFKSLELTGYWIDESCEVQDQIKLMLKNRIGRYPAKCPVRFGVETTNPPDTESSTYQDYFGKPLPNHKGFKQPPRENDANLRPGYYDDLIRDYGHNRDWIQRYIMGEWGITIKGKAVYNNFRSSFHVAQEPLIWTGGQLFTGWDNSGNTPACVIVQVPTAGAIQVLRCYHTEKMGIVDFASSVVMQRNVDFPSAEYTEWGDPAGFAKFSRKGGGLTSNVELMKDVGIKLEPSDQNWLARKEAVETQLGKMVSGEPGLLIDPSCTRLINGFIGGYCYPEIGVTGHYGDDPVKNKYSHPHDALQYVCVMLNQNVAKARRERRRHGNEVSLGDYRSKNIPQSSGYVEVRL
jgi:hypothetical protein